jgi:hypothetical protein
MGRLVTSNKGSRRAVAFNMHLEWTTAGSALLVKYDGELDQRGTQRIGRLLSRLRKLDRLVLDLGSARVLQDASLAALVPLLATQSAYRIMVRGLSRHHLRVLRYLSTGPAATPAQHFDLPS